MMDDSKTFELKVGVFILVGVAILFIIVFSIGDINLSKTGYRINVLFNFASGIGPSAPVRLAGVGIGQVQGIHVIHDPKDNKTKAELTAWINDNIKIEEDAVVTINTLGLLGEKYLEILPGTPGAAAVKPNGTLIGKDPVPMEKITENLATLSESVKTIVDKIKCGEGTIGKLLTDDAIYDNLEAFTADIKRHPWKLLNKPRNEE
jgi:phospholipid/cholesterol/gamma-HCH transport system substrate-binding protein